MTAFGLGHLQIGGRNNNPEGFDKGYDIVFTVRFRSREAIDKFTDDPREVDFRVRGVGMGT